MNVGVDEIDEIVAVSLLEYTDGIEPLDILSVEDLVVEKVLEFMPDTEALSFNDDMLSFGVIGFDDIKVNDITATGDVDGAMTFGGLLYPMFTNLTVTNGAMITMASTVYALDSAGAVTITLSATGTEGQLLILIGDDANNITINDTNVRTNDGGVQVLGQYDVWMAVLQDSEWIEISESNNS